MIRNQDKRFSCSESCVFSQFYVPQEMGLTLYKYHEDFTIMPRNNVICTLAGYQMFKSQRHTTNLVCILQLLRLLPLHTQFSLKFLTYVCFEYSKGKREKCHHAWPYLKPSSFCYPQHHPPC